MLLGPGVRQEPVSSLVQAQLLDMGSHPPVIFSPRHKQPTGRVAQWLMRPAWYP
jgi:hypothetical protein